MTSSLHSVWLKAVPPRVQRSPIIVKLQAVRVTAKLLYTVLFPDEPLVTLFDERDRLLARDDDTSVPRNLPLLIVVKFSWDRADDGVPVRLLQRLGVGPKTATRKYVTVTHAETKEYIEFVVHLLHYEQLYIMAVPASQVFKHTMGARVLYGPHDKRVMDTPRCILTTLDEVVTEDPAMALEAVDDETFDSFVVGKSTRLAGHTVVVDLEVVEGITSRRASALLAHAVRFAQDKHCNSVTLRLSDAQDFIFEAKEEGFEMNPGGQLMHKFLVHPLPKGPECTTVIKMRQQDLQTTRPDLIEDMRSMCYLLTGSAAESVSNRHVFVSFSPASSLPCAVAIVDMLPNEDDEDTEDDPPKWDIAYLCSNIRGSGKALVQHILRDAQASGIRTVTIFPINSELRKQYLSWWPWAREEDEAEEEGSVITYDTSASTIQPPASKRQRVGPAADDTDDVSASAAASNGGKRGARLLKKIRRLRR